jgi:hypothetical protein
MKLPDNDMLFALLTILLLFALITSIPLALENASGTQATPTGSIKSVEIIRNRTVAVTLGVFSVDVEYTECQITITDPLSWTFKGIPEDLGWENDSYTFSSSLPSIYVNISDGDGNRMISEGDSIIIDAMSEHLVKGNWSVALIDIISGGTMDEISFEIIHDYPDPYEAPAPDPFPYGILIFILWTIFILAFIYTVIRTDKRKR